MANKGGHLMSKETWNVLHSKPKKSLFFNTPGTYSILHANLYENYSVVKDSNSVYCMPNPSPPPGFEKLPTPL